jgi:hypothetical protein
VRATACSVVSMASIPRRPFSAVGSVRATVRSSAVARRARPWARTRARRCRRAVGVVARVAARGEHDGGVAAQLARDVQAVDVGEVDVEEDDLGPEVAAARRASAASLASPTTCHPSASSRRRARPAKPVVVIDDEHRWHAPIVLAPPAIA